MKILNVLQTLGRYALELVSLLIVLAVAVFLFMVMVSPAEAAGTTARLTWTLPTQRIDNSPLPASSIREVVVSWRRTAAGPEVGNVRLAGAVSSADVPGLVCGDFVFTVLVVDQGSLESDPSSPPAAYATGIACRPKAATGVTAT
jgi:hypothetical protein